MRILSISFSSKACFLECNSGKRDSAPDPRGPRRNNCANTNPPSATARTPKRMYVVLRFMEDDSLTFPTRCHGWASRCVDNLAAADNPDAEAETDDAKHHQQPGHENHPSYIRGLIQMILVARLALDADIARFFAQPGERAGNQRVILGIHRIAGRHGIIQVRGKAGVADDDHARLGFSTAPEHGMRIARP